MRKTDDYDVITIKVRRASHLKEAYGQLRGLKDMTWEQFAAYLIDRKISHELLRLKNRSKMGGLNGPKAQRMATN